MKSKLLAFFIKLEDIWFYLDGKKTIIGLMIGGAYALGASFGLWTYEDSGAVMRLAEAVCGVGLAHKGAKIIRG